jgi:hypothetical protein
VRALVQRIAGWPVVLPGVVLAAVLAFASMRLRPPAAVICLRCVTAIEILLFLRLVSWVVVSGHRFGREQRLATFVMFSTIAFSWLLLREDIAEAAFDYQVARQQQELAVPSRTLAYQIEGFLAERRRIAPAPPRPATWDADLANFGRFETDTVLLYERRYGAQVRAAHDLLSMRSLRDRDFDTFYRHPANAFQMHVIAGKLAFLSTKVEPPSK